MDRSLGRVAYEAYAQFRVAYEADAQSTDWKNLQGNPMPQWYDLPDKIRLAWEAAADAVYEEESKEERERDGDKF